MVLFLISAKCHPSPFPLSPFPRPFVIVDRYPFQVPQPEKSEEDEDDYEIPDAAKYTQDEDTVGAKAAANKH